MSNEECLKKFLAEFGVKGRQVKEFHNIADCENKLGKANLVKSKDFSECREMVKRLAQKLEDEVIILFGALPANEAEQGLSKTTDNHYGPVWKVVVEIGQQQELLTKTYDCVGGMTVISKGENTHRVASVPVESLFYNDLAANPYRYLRICDARSLNKKSPKKKDSKEQGKTVQ